MNNFIKQIIEERFESKKLSSKRKNKRFVEKKEVEDEKEIDEIVDENGNIARGNKPLNFDTVGTTSHSTSDEVTKMSHGQTGGFGIQGLSARKYWNESDMSKSLGYEDTLGKDEDIKKAKKHFEKDLDLPDDEAEERLEKMGYDPELPKGKVRLIENPKKFIEEYLEEILTNKSKADELVKKDENENNSKIDNPVVVRQLKSLKQTLKDNNITINDVLSYLKDDE